VHYFFCIIVLLPGVDKQFFEATLRWSSTNHRHLNAMIAWACRHVRWTRAMWSRKRVSDESRFNLRTADGRVRIVRRKGEHFAAKNDLLERDRIGGGLGDNEW